jgi:hypothetical protein
MTCPWNEEKVDAVEKEGFQALGKIVYFFQQLEDDLRQAASFLIDPENSTMANIVVCEQSFKQLVNLAGSLFAQYAEAKDTKRTKEWRSLLQQALKAEADRNSILHSTFGVSIDEPVVFSRIKTTAKFKRGFKESGEALDLDTVNAYLDTIATVGPRITEFMGRVFPKWNTREWKREH